VSDYVIPDVDVIIPFHRNDDFLREAIASAHASIGVRPHLILVNDTGGGIARESLGLSESDSLVMNRQKGYLGALSTGVTTSTSPYVAFLDSDDLTDPLRLKKQINRLQIDGVDYVSGRLQKFKKFTKSGPRVSPLGVLPNSSDSRLLLFIGAHGADSTIVAKGLSIRKSWKIHASFSSAVADYGWLLSAICQGHTLSHENDAIYYYRSHQGQLSRANSLKEGWLEVWPLWDALRTQEILKLNEFSRLSITSSTALALTFPATLPSLNSTEIKMLKKVIQALLADLMTIDHQVINIWKISLWRRYIIAAKLHDLSKANYFPGFFYDIARQSLSGVKIRRGS
jgi:glycosyltransferase involved in cell wall biosynthesis